MQNAYEKKENIWIERLELERLCILIFRSLFCGAVIRYDEHCIPLSVKFVIKYLKQTNLRDRFLPIDMSLAKRETESAAIAYEVDSDLRIPLNEFCVQYLSEEPQNYKNMVKCYLSQFLRKRVSFVCAVKHEIMRFQDKISQRNIIYVRRHPLNKVIIAFYSTRGIILRESFGIIASIKYFSLPFCYVASIFLSKLLKFKVRTNIEIIRPCVWVEHSCKDLCDFSFWARDIGTKDFDIIYYLDRKDTPLSQKILSEIEDGGKKFIDAHGFSLLKMSGFDFLSIKELFSTLNYRRARYPGWYAVFKFQYAFWFFVYRSVFKKFKVKVLIQHQDASWKQEVQARAIEYSGGILVGFHWSNYPCVLSPQHLFPFHVFFVWGKLFYDLLSYGGNTCRYILPSGLWITQSSEKISNYLKNTGLTVSIFDSSVGYNIQQTPKTLSEFYLMIIRLFEANPSWALIIKSKSFSRIEDFYSLPCGKEISAKLKLLLEEKRAVILNPVISPVAAAKLSHLSVCYGMNSAGIIVGVYGYRAIHWDCSGWLHHPFYKDDSQKFVYATLEEIERAILKVSQGDQDIGNFSQWRQKYNYFNDYDAHKRVGEFIQSFLDEITQTEDLEHSLVFSIRKYNEINRIGESFLNADSYWEDE